MGSFSLIRQAFPLPDAEAMLFVRDHQGKIPVFHLFLNQGMGTHNHMIFPVRDGLIDPLLLPCRRGTGEKNGTDAQILLLTQLQKRFKMLGRQHLRGRHQTSLPAVCRAHQKGKKGENGLSASHIPLYQTVHRRLFAHILFDLPPDLKLRSCQPVRKLFQQPVRIRNPPQNLLHPSDLIFIFQPGKAEKKGEKFIEGKPSSGIGQFLHVLRTVNLSHCLPPGNQSVFPPKLFRKKFLQAVQLLQCCPHRPGHQPVGHPLCQRIPWLEGILDGSIILHAENGGLFHPDDSRSLDPARAGGYRRTGLSLRLPCASRLTEPAEHMHASRLQDAADIGHSKKGDTKKAGCISGLYIRYDQGAHPCDLGRADHRRLHGAYPSGHQRRHGNGRFHLLIISRVVLQKLSHICDMESGEKLCRLFADSLNGCQSCLNVHSVFIQLK